MNILVVDDEPVMVESITIGLESKGYRTVKAFSAEDALEQLSSGQHHPVIDLVVTDYLMPNMSGLDLLAAVRKSQPTLPIMIMTAYAETSLVIEALKNHCDSFIEKPFNLEQLVVEIERIKPRRCQNTKASELHRLLPRIAHQINNPLSTITGYTQLIGLNSGNGESIQRYVNEILIAVERISHINKIIMNAGRLEEGEIQPEEIQPIALDSLLESCLEMFNGLFILKEIQVDKNIPVVGLRVLGDRFSLEQVFKNLILNGVEAMDGRPDKRLTATIAPLPATSAVEIIIEDTGCGIRTEHLDKIFEPYFTSKRDGNGLGLEIIRNIVEKHGGKVRVESRVGIGSTFYVHLPTV